MFGRMIVAAVLMSCCVTLAQAKGIEAPKRVADNLWVMGVPAETDIESFAANGGDIVVSLLSHEEMNGSLETQWTTENGVAFFHIPINGASGVTFENARALDKLLLRHEDQTILVHCASANRVGALFALRAGWLDGLSVEDALAVGRQHGLTSLEEKVSKMLAE